MSERPLTQLGATSSMVRPCRAFSNFRGFPLFARNVLVGLNRLVVQVNFSNADIVVPCCRTNMDWEAWMGSLRGNNSLRRKALQYIYPVTNGMETDRFLVDRGAFVF